MGLTLGHRAARAKVSTPVCVTYSFVSNSFRTHGLQPTSLLCSWDSPGKNTGVGSHSLLQGIFPTQGLNPGLLHYRQILYCLSLPLGDFKSEQVLTLELGFTGMQHRFPFNIYLIFSLEMDGEPGNCVRQPSRVRQRIETQTRKRKV